MRLLLIGCLLSGCSDRPLWLPEAIGPIYDSRDLAAPPDLGAELDLAAAPDALDAALDADAPPDLFRHDGPLVMTIAAGRPGGSGNADDSGADARLGVSLSLALTDDGSTAFSLESTWKVRRIDVASGQVTTWLSHDSYQAGGVSCRPGSLSLDGRGHLWVLASAYNTASCRRIWQADLATGAISDLAPLPSVIAAPMPTTHDDQAMYLANRDRLFAIDLDSGVSREIPVVTAGGDKISFWARALALAGSRLQIGSMTNPPVIAVDLPSGVAQPLDVLLFGNSEPLAFAEPASNTAPRLWAGGHDKMYLENASGVVLRLLPYPTRLVDDVSRWLLPYADFSLWSFADNAGGDLIFSDFRVSRDGGAVFRVARPGSQPAAPQLLAGLVRGPLFGGPGADPLLAPSSLAADASGLYALDATAQQIFRIGAETRSLAGAGPRPDFSQPLDGVGNSAVLVNPAGLARGGDDLLYFCEQPANGDTTGRPWLRSLRPSTGQVTTLLSGLPWSCQGSSAALDGNGWLWFSNRFLLAVDPASGAVKGPANLDPTRPTGGITSDGGTLYVGYGHSVARLEPDGSLQPIAGDPDQAGSADGPTAQARFLTPAGLVADGRGSLFVADPDDATVRRIDLGSGVVTPFAGQHGLHGVKAGPLPARLNRPTALALTPLGDLAITDSAEGVVLLIAPAQ